MNLFCSVFMCFIVRMYFSVESKRRKVEESKVGGTEVSLPTSCCHGDDL